MSGNTHGSLQCCVLLRFVMRRLWQDIFKGSLFHLLATIMVAMITVITIKICRCFEFKSASHQTSRNYKTELHILFIIYETRNDLPDESPY